MEEEFKVSNDAKALLDAIGVEKEFNLSELWDNPPLLNVKRLSDWNLEKVKEFIKGIEKIYANAQMYADMDEPDFWSSSTISPMEAQKRADYFGEFLEQIKQLAGDKLT